MQKIESIYAQIKNQFSKEYKMIFQNALDQRQIQFQNADNTKRIKIVRECRYIFLQHLLSCKLYDAQILIDCITFLCLNNRTPSQHHNYSDFLDKRIFVYNPYKN